MAAITITAANVARGAGAFVRTDALAGETVTAGQAVYLKESDGRWWLAQADGTAAEAVFGGITLNGAAAGQPLFVQTLGQITIGGTVAVGTIYVLDAVAGGIHPSTDLGASDYVTIIGVGITTGIINISPLISGVEVP